jgi:hypothetical protein
MKNMAHTFIRNFKTKGRVIVSSDLSIFDSTGKSLLRGSVPGESIGGGHSSLGHSRDHHMLKIWNEILDLLLFKTPFPNVLTVGVRLKIPAKLVKTKHIFVYHVNHLDDLSFDQINLFNLVVVNPLKLCAGFSEKNFCMNEIEGLLHFRDKSVFNSIYVVPKVSSEEEARNTDYLTSLYGLSKYNNDYFFSQNIKLNQLFLEKFISVLTDIHIDTTVTYERNLILSNCLNHQFKFPTVQRFGDVNEHFEYFQKIDFTQFELSNLATNLKSIKKGIYQCMSTMKLSNQFFNQFLLS